MSPPCRCCISQNAGNYEAIRKARLEKEKPVGWLLGVVGTAGTDQRLQAGEGSDIYPQPGTVSCHISGIWKVQFFEQLE